jgi:hypothetical protein
MPIVKQVRNWSYETLDREVRASAVYRTFCCIGLEKVPDAKSLVLLGQAIGSAAVGELYNRVVAVAQEHKVIRVHKMRGRRIQCSLPDQYGLLQDGAPIDAEHEEIEQKAGGL